jgi:hypothetical protein
MGFLVVFPFFSRYLTNYSKALMSVVPQNSILITAFDQQWTTVRYLHECEGYRYVFALVLLTR